VGEWARTPDRQTDTESDNKGHLKLSGAREPTDSSTDNKGRLDLSGVCIPILSLCAAVDNVSTDIKSHLKRVLHA